MKVYIGLGSNLGNRKENLEWAARELSSFLNIEGVAPVFQTAALMKEDSPAEWNLPYLNSVVSGEFSGSPRELLNVLKKTEQVMGRSPSASGAIKWAPRLIDLDLLIFGDQVIAESDLQVPHPGMTQRSFVLDPLKHLAPLLKLVDTKRTILELARDLRSQSPLWMGILNLTPDSFSDAVRLTNLEAFEKQVHQFCQIGTHVLDLGAESTRPGAQMVTLKEEWERLQVPLRLTVEKIKGQWFRPLISVDTRNFETAEKALAAGADWINDVSGMNSPAMVELIRAAGCPVLVMHSLDVPANANHTWPEGSDPIAHLKVWATDKLESLTRAGISLSNIILDPGIGFGKSAQQSLQILSRIDELYALPARWLVGHSRKSFMRVMSQASPRLRDAESVGISIRLAERHVDILRVHDPEIHMSAHLAWSHLSRPSVSNF